MSTISHPFNSASLPSVPAPSSTTEGMRRARSLGAVGPQQPAPSMVLPDIPPVASSSGTRRRETYGGSEGGGGREPKHLPRWDESKEGSIAGSARSVGERDARLGEHREEERRGGASNTVEAQDGHEQDGLGDGSPAPSSGSATPPRSARSAHSAQLGYGRTSPIQSQPAPDHLPFLEEGSRDPTALANWNVANEMEFAISRVVGEHVLEEMMRDKSEWLRAAAASKGELIFIAEQTPCAASAITSQPNPTRILSCSTSTTSERLHPIPFDNANPPPLAASPSSPPSPPESASPANPSSKSTSSNLLPLASRSPSPSAAPSSNLFTALPRWDWGCSPLKPSF